MIHRFMPKKPGQFGANQSYWMYQGWSALDRCVVWWLGLDYDKLNGHSEPQIDRAAMLRNMPSAWVMLGLGRAGK